MDPNEALARCRAALAVIGSPDRPAWSGPEVRGAVADLQEHFSALDSWLARGGFLPAPWTR